MPRQLRKKLTGDWNGVPGVQPPVRPCEKLAPVVGDIKVRYGSVKHILIKNKCF
jgi:hypothetical protein